MKLLIVTPYFYPKIGGLENYAYNIALGLKKQYKWDIVIVTSNHKEKKDIIESIKGMKIYRLAPILKISNTPINPFWYRKIKKIINKEHPDIINAHTPVPFISDIVARIKQDIPFILTYHNDLVKSNILFKIITKLYYRFLGNKTLSIASVIITTSPLYLKKSPYLNIYRKKTVIITPGVHLSLFTNNHLKNNLIKKYNKTKNILFVGNLDKTHNHKGLKFLIEAMSIIKQKVPQVTLFIVGKGDNKRHFETLVNKLNLQKEILFFDNVTNYKLPTYYSIADVVVLPSINDSEGFGMILIEGMACKKPTVGTRIGGIPYVIDANKTGLLIKPRNTSAISKAIIKIISDTRLAKKMGENGYKKVVNEFTWKKQIDKTQKLFKNV